MRIARVLALSAAALVSIGLLTAPPASAATNVVIDCAEATTREFSVTPGEQILFYVSPACLSVLSIDNEADFIVFVNTVKQINTGGSATADWVSEPPSVIYTAGATPGTDSIDLERWLLRLRIGYRDLPALPAFYMTVPAGDAGPAPWFQAVGRPDQTATCPATYGPSWAKWMNAGTGGWVCVREYYYNSSLGDWSYRQG
jgi:hypothetical protein